MLRLFGNYEHKDFLASCSLEYNGKIRGNGRIGSRRFGTLDCYYEDGSLTLYSRPSLLTRFVSKLGYVGCIGLGLLAGLSTYSSMMDNPYRAVASIAGAVAVGLLSFFVMKKSQYRIKI